MKNSKLLRIISAVLVMVFMMSTCCEVALAAPKQQYVVVNQNKITLDLAGTYKYQISGYVYPTQASQKVTFKSGSTNIATVSSSGLITAKKVGTVKIGCRPSSVKKWTYITVNVINSKAPTSISVGSTTLNLNVGGTYKIPAALSPANAYGGIGFKTSNKKIAKVSSAGTITAVKKGSAKIRVYSKYNTKLYKDIKVNVIDTRTPTSLALNLSSSTIEPGNKLQLKATQYPSTTSSEVVWKSSKSSVASVNANGLVTAKKTGTALIRAYSKYSNKVYDTMKLTVKYGATPSSIVISGGDVIIQKGTGKQLTAVTTPATASQLFKWASESTSIATVDSTGYVKGIKAGKTRVKVASKRNTKIQAIINVQVYDPTVPTEVKLSQTYVYLGAGDSISLTSTVKPDTSNPNVIWGTSNSKVATVVNGKITAVAPGTCTVGVKTVAGGLKATCTVTVLNTNRTTTLPEKTTNISGIRENLAKINAVRISAEHEIDNYVKTGKISSSEGSERKEIIKRGFNMIAFPWMTLKNVNYWMLSNSNGGAKNFKTDIVYYGLPYTQNYRTYDVAKALTNNHYTDSGKGYYLLNTENLISGNYVGNDCSGFVSLAQWGQGSPYSHLNTTGMASSAAYKTVSKNVDNLVTGDIFLKGGHHTLMFLYFTDTAKTRAMVIEQGGGGTSTNTVNISIQNISSLFGTYTIKRKTSFR